MEKGPRIKDGREFFVQQPIGNYGIQGVQVQVDLLGIFWEYFGSLLVGCFVMALSASPCSLGDDCDWIRDWSVIGFDRIRDWIRDWIEGARADTQCRIYVFV